MNKIQDNSYTKIIKKKIDENQFKTKDELIDYLNKSKNIILHDEFLNQEFNDHFIKLNDESIKEMFKYLLEYYDKKNILEDSVKLDTASQVEIDGQEYIKVSDGNGNYKILENNQKENLVEQFNEVQNSSMYYQTENREENQRRVLDEMGKQKINVELDSSLNVNTRELTSEEKVQFATLMHLPNADKINFLVEPTRNIYINKDTGEVFHAHMNNQGQMEIRKDDEINGNEFKNEETTYDDEVISTPDVEMNFASLSDSDLQYMQNDSRFSFEEQKAIAEEIEKREKGKEKESATVQKETHKVFVKKMNEVMTRPYNGFVSLMFLCSIVGLFGFLFLAILLNNIHIYGSFLVPFLFLNIR